MKNIIKVFCVLLVLILFVGCSTGNTDITDGNNVDTTDNTDNSEKSAKEKFDGALESLETNMESKAYTVKMTYYFEGEVINSNYYFYSKDSFIMDQTNSPAFGNARMYCNVDGKTYSEPEGVIDEASYNDMCGFFNALESVDTVINSASETTYSTTDNEYVLTMSIPVDGLEENYESVLKVKNDATYLLEESETMVNDKLDTFEITIGEFDVPEFIIE